MQVWPTFVQLNVCREFFNFSDDFDSRLGEEGADARFGTYLTHSKQNTRYDASLFFLLKGARRLGVIYFSV